MKNIIILFILSISLVSCGQKVLTDSTNYVIDEDVSKIVESRISESEYGIMPNKIPIYKNSMILDYFENDSLILSINGEENSIVFKSFFYTYNDTLTIDGAFGMFEGFGFSIKIKNNKAIVYHLAASDELPIYSLNENDSLKYRIEVPCTDTKITLSKIPELKESEIVYGIVEFKSEDYYKRGPLLDEQEIEPRKKIRANMKIYFKSMYLDIEKMK